MDRAGSEIGRDPNSPFSQRLATLIAQGAESQQVDFGRVLEALHLPRHLFDDLSTYRSETKRALNHILDLLTSREDFEPRAFLENRIQREWLLTQNEGLPLLWSAMDRAGVDTWIRWYREASTTRVQEAYRRY